MAKRRQTTGLPKAKVTKPVAEAEATGPQKGYLSRAEREAQIQRYIWMGIAAIIAVTLIILAIAFINDRVINPSRSVAVVNDDKITINEYRERVKLERVIAIQQINTQLNTFLAFGFTTDVNEVFEQLYQYDPAFKNAWDELQVPDQMGLRVLNDMIDDKIVRAEAERLGITVTEEDVNKQLEDLLGFNADLLIDPEATEEPTPEPTATATPLVSPIPSPTATLTPVPETTEEATAEVDAEPTVTPFPTIPPAPTRTIEEQQADFNDAVDNLYELLRIDAGVSKDEAYKFFEAKALRLALSEHVVETSDTVTWVNARHILVATEEEALNIIEALNAGESFAELARVHSLDSGQDGQGGSAAVGGELDWANSNNYVEEFKVATQTLEIGAISEPISTQFGFHIIQVRAREEREASENEIETQRRVKLDEWLTEFRAEQDIEIKDIWPDNVPTSPQFFYTPA